MNKKALPNFLFLRNQTWLKLNQNQLSNSWETKHAWNWTKQLINLPCNAASKAEQLQWRRQECCDPQTSCSHPCHQQWAIVCGRAPDLRRWVHLILRASSWELFRSRPCSVCLRMCSSPASWKLCRCCPRVREPRMHAQRRLLGRGRRRASRTETRAPRRAGTRSQGQSCTGSPPCKRVQEDWFQRKHLPPQSFERQHFLGPGLGLRRWDSWDTSGTCAAWSRSHRWTQRPRRKGLLGWEPARDKMEHNS